MQKPSGVIAVAVFTLLASIILGFFTLLLTLLYFVGGELSTGPNPLPFILWSELPIILLTLYAFSLSIALLASTSRIVYYSAIVFWTLFTLLFVYLGYALTWRDLGSLIRQIPTAFGYYSFLSIILSAAPLAYSIACLLYFTTSRVKEYFKVDS